MITREDYSKQAEGKYIAVDYDDTITLYKPYPQKAAVNPEAKKYLDKLNKLGFIIILWTARIGDAYEEAYDRCINEFGLTYIKKDSPTYLHGDSGKLVASYYIDDKASFGKVNWKKTFKYIISKYCK